jgi:8-oxo-dGTP diphosphatase
MPTLGVFAAISDEGGCILCVRMNYATCAWTTPGGRVEHGESPLDALKREVLEESGLDVEAGELVGVYSKPYKDDIVLFFRASMPALEDQSGSCRANFGVQRIELASGKPPFD